MAQVKITERSLEGLRKDARKQGKLLWLWDTETRGFGVRASARGSLSFVFQYWIGGRGGKAKRITLAATSLETARIEADAKRHSANNGCLVSPRQERLEKQRKELSEKSISEVVKLYLDEHNEAGRYWSDLEMKFNNQIVPTLKEACKLRPEDSISKVDKPHLRDFFKVYNDRPGAKRGMYSALSPFFKWLAAEDYISSNPLAQLAAPKIPESRDRKLSDSEIKAFWKATGLMGYPWAPFFRLLLLTAQRRDEVAAMEWREIRGNEWTIPRERTKNGKEHIVHLSGQALAELPARGKSKTLVFSTTGETPISGYSKAKARLDGLMQDLLPLSDVLPWRTHDLRRTSASGMARIGIEPHVIERVLNHLSGSQGGLQGVYQQYEYIPERKRALAAWGEAVALIVTF